MALPRRNDAGLAAAEVALAVEAAVLKTGAIDAVRPLEMTLPKIVCSYHLLPYFSQGRGFTELLAIV